MVPPCYLTILITGRKFLYFNFSIKIMYALFGKIIIYVYLRLLEAICNGIIPFKFTKFFNYKPFGAGQ